MGGDVEKVRGRGMQRGFVRVVVGCLARERRGRVSIGDVRGCLWWMVVVST